MSRVQVWYLGPGRVFRRRWVNQKQEHPVSIVNEKDRQLHILRGDPIFVKETPTDLVNLEEILTIKPPYIGPMAEDRMMLVEENNPWPIAMQSRPLTLPEQIEQLWSMRQEWIQESKKKARDKNLGELSMTAQKIQMFIALGFGALIGVMAVMVMVNEREPTAGIIGVIQRLVA